MRLKKSTHDAIRILSACANAKSELTRVAELSEGLDITQQNVFKLVHILSHAGFVQCVRGRNGGVKLARPASEIHIGSVVRKIEMVVSGPPAKRGKRAPQLDHLVDDALEAFLEVLDDQSLADISTKKKPRAKKKSGSKKQKMPRTRALSKRRTSRTARL